MTDRRLQFFPIVGSGARVSVNFVRMVRSDYSPDETIMWLDEEGGDEETEGEEGRYYFFHPKNSTLPVVVFDEVEL